MSAKTHKNIKPRGNYLIHFQIPTEPKPVPKMLPGKDTILTTITYQILPFSEVKETKQTCIEIQSNIFLISYGFNFHK